MYPKKRLAGGAKKKIYCIVLKENPGGAIVHSLCAFIVRLHCALHCALSSFLYCALCVKPLCAHCAQSLCAAVVHNGKPPSLHNEAAQCKSIVRSAWHNGRAYISEAKSAWHNDFVIVRFFFDWYFLNTIQYNYPRNITKGLNM